MSHDETTQDASPILIMSRIDGYDAYPQNSNCEDPNAFSQVQTAFRPVSHIPCPRPSTSVSRSSHC